MKKLLFILLALLIAGSGYAQKAPTTKLISSSKDRVVVSVELNGYNTIKVQTPRGEQMVIAIPGTGTTIEAGAPELPMFPIPVMIGDMAEMTVNIIDAQYTDVNNIDVAPFKGNFSRQIDPADVPYTYGPMYDENAFYPAAQATLEAPYIVRDFRGQNIMVHPFAYNPATHTLRVYNNLTIEMVKVSDNGENPKSARKSSTIKVTPEQKAAYARRFINFNADAKDYPFITDNGEMLVICADQFMPGMEEFVNWKNQSGRPTTMVSVTTAGGNNADAIKSYITNMYNDPDHNLVYVLFVGDYNHITPHPFSYEGTQYSDIWFGMVEGTDYYPEVFIGRFSVQTDAHVATQVNKVLYYERDMQEDVEWGDKGLGIGAIGAGSGHYGEDDYQHIDLIRDTLLHYTYTNITDSHQGGGATAAGFSSIINSGIGIINYCNHGSETSWGVCNYSTSHVNALTNDNMLPIVWSVACLNGKFDYGGNNGECFGEAWMRATNNSTGVPTGAIGGMFSWISQPWQPPMYGQDEMVDILTEWRHTDQFNHTLAGTSLNGAMGVLDHGTSSQFTATQHSWILFGDPSLMVRTANPTNMNASVSPSVLMLGMTELQVSAEADYAIATLSMDGEVIASGEVVNGQCTLTFPAISNVGVADIVIVGFNKVTYVGQIEVVPAEGAYIAVDTYAMNVDQANYGETIDMTVNVKNVGVEVASNLTATLTTECEYVEILSGEATIGSVDPDQIVTVEGFQFIVAEDVPDGTVAHFFLDVTDGTDTWQGKINITLHAPVVVLESYNINNGQVEFQFKNNGTAPFNGGIMTLTSCSPDLVFDPEIIESAEVINGGETLTMGASYTVAETVEPGTTFEASYQFTSGLFEIEDIFVVSHGAIMEDFEAGSFGPDWTFSQTNAWTIVDGGAKGKCAKSMNNGIANSNYTATLTVDVLAPGDLTFMYKVSSENNYDKLHFFMDNIEKGTWSGDVNWTQFTQAVTAGHHTFMWSYTKDGSVNSGSDCAYIDEIQFPPTNVITFLAPATNLNAELEGSTVTLTWMGSTDADKYVVKRNGEQIDEVTETSYVDNLPKDGTYTYQVYAAKENGSLSTPISATVIAEFDAVNDNLNVKVRTYPNPVNDVLTIVTDANNFKYELINSLGQVVRNGNANMKAVVSVSDLNKGVYFLRISAGNAITTQKVVVE